MWKAESPTSSRIPPSPPSLLNLQRFNSFDLSVCVSGDLWFFKILSLTSASMDVVAAASGYISKMVTVGESSGASKMKILLLDSETVGSTQLTLAVHH